MTEVEFHTGVADTLAFACRLLRKAHRRGVRVLVTAAADTLAALDRELWIFDARDFVPHVRVPGAAAALAQRTPIWLALEVDSVSTAGVPAVLLNLGAAAPSDLGPLQRLIEVVGADPEQAEQGRRRWRDYKARGLHITHHAPGTVRD